MHRTTTGLFVAAILVLVMAQRGTAASLLPPEAAAIEDDRRGTRTESERWFPALDLAYALHNDSHIDLHSWSARAGIGIVTDGPTNSEVDWLFPSFRFFYEHADTGPATRRGVLACFEYHRQVYSFPFTYVRPEYELGNQQRRRSFPLERQMPFGIVVGAEIGFVNSRNLFSPESEDGFRIGGRGRFSGLIAEISLDAAWEHYDDRELAQFGIYVSPLFRTLLPFGPFVGYRHSSTKGWHENAFVAGFEANF